MLGGKRAAITNKLKYGDDFYARIGAIGGRNGHTGGFYARRDIASSAGRKGGQISRRGAATKRESNATLGYPRNASPAEKSYLSRLKDRVGV
jgi:general stress protein YciG